MEFDSKTGPYYPTGGNSDGVKEVVSASPMILSPWIALVRENNINQHYN